MRNKFMNQYTWYEEYPFSDGLYVLNGFMYSMIGLYDLFTADGAPEELHFTAKEIFDLGFESLKVNFWREKLKKLNEISANVAVIRQWEGNKLRYASLHQIYCT